MAANVRRSPNLTLGRLITCVPPSPRTRRKGEHDKRQRQVGDPEPLDRLELPSEVLPGAAGRKT